MARFPDIPREKMTEQQRSVADAIQARRTGGLSGPYIPMLYSPEVASRSQLLSEFLRFHTGLSRPLMYLAVMITARHWDCQMEFLVHKNGGLREGLSAEICEAVGEGRRPARMTGDEALIHDFCIELFETGRVSDANFDPAAERFGRKTILELLAMCGYFSMLAMVLNVTDIPLPGGAAPPLKPLAR